MSDRHAGLLAHLKEEVPEVITIHCVIYHQHLKKLSGVLHESLQMVITGVNKIKANSLKVTNSGMDSRSILVISLITLCKVSRSEVRHVRRKSFSSRAVTS